MKCPLNNIGLEKIFCLNLERRPDRKEYAMKQFEKIGLEGVEFIKAQDAKALGLKSELMDITPGMIGCYNSHREIMKHCIDNDIKSYLVLEDDPLFIEGFNEFIDMVLKHIPNDWDFAYLGCTEHNGFGTHLKQINDFWVVPRSAWGTQAFMMRGRAIKKVYDMLENMQMQIDCQLSLITLPKSGLNYYNVFPSCVEQYWDIGSDIQQRANQKIKN